MKKRLAIVAGLATCAGLATVTAVWAQRQAPPTAVLVDVASVAENAPRLKESLEALKKEFEAAGESFKQESERGNQLMQQFGKLTPNSAEYKEMEQRLTKMKADFELRGKRITEDFKDREAKLYYEHARELNAETARFGQSTGVLLVLRYDPPQADIKDPRRVMREVSNPVVYQRGLDATAALQQRLGGAAPPTATRPAQTAPAQRPPVQR
ncbi:MAG: OmpH family outer membrane protein [Pirellulales bacterium]